MTLLIGTEDLLFIAVLEYTASFSLLLTKTFSTFTYTKKYIYDDYESQDILVYQN